MSILNMDLKDLFKKKPKAPKQDKPKANSANGKKDQKSFSSTNLGKSSKTTENNVFAKKTKSKVVTINNTLVYDCIIEFNTIGQNYIKFTKLKNNNISETKVVDVIGFYFKNEYVIDEENVLKLIEKNIDVKEFKNIYLVVKSTLTTTSYYTIPKTNVFNKGKILQNEIYNFLNFDKDQVFIKKISGDTHLETYRTFSIPTDLYNSYVKLLSKIHIKVGGLILEGDYIKFDLNKPGDINCVVTRTKSVATCFIMSDNQIVYEENIEAFISNKTEFMISLSCCISNFESKYKKIDKYYYIDNKGYLKDFFTKIGLRAEEIKDENKAVEKK